MKVLLEELNAAQDNRAEEQEKAIQAHETAAKLTNDLDQVRAEVDEAG